MKVKLQMSRFSIFKIAFPCVVSLTLISASYAQTIVFRNTVTGAVIDLSFAKKEGRDTKAVKHFFKTGENIYNENPDFYKKAETLYLTACSGCHGHLAEGKVGPGLSDSYWTYLKNTTDKGMFETVFDGARAMMGPQRGNLTLDEMLLSMSWVRHLYTGEPETAKWLSKEQRSKFKPYKEEKKHH